MEEETGLRSSGSSHARGQAIRATTYAQIKQARDVEKKAEFGRKLKRLQQRLWDRAIEAGEPTRLVLPHPDDIILDDACGFRLVGPFDEASLLKLEREIKKRDVLILQAELEDRLDWDEERDRDTTIPKDIGNGSALLLAILINQTLPEQHRLSDSEWVWATWKHQRKTKRDLLKETRQAWRSLGMIKPRGWRTAPISLTCRMLTAAKPHLRELMTAVREKDEEARQEVLAKLISDWMALHSSSTPPAS